MTEDNFIVSDVFGFLIVKLSFAINRSSLLFDCEPANGGTDLTKSHLLPSTFAPGVQHNRYYLISRLHGTASLLCWVQRSRPMLGAGGGGVWLLCRVSLVFVLNSSVPSFTGAAVLMMLACVELCENPPCAGHYLEGFCPLTSSHSVDSCFPSSFLPIKCRVVVPSHLAVFYGSAHRSSKSQRPRASVSFLKM